MIESWDSRRDLFIGKTKEETIAFAVEHWIHTAKRSIQQKGHFAVALSGGSTPEAIYKELAKQTLDWSRVFLFWGDERSVPPTDPQSNYKMAMESGFDRLPIPKNQIFRMQAESHLEKNCADYEDLIRRLLPHSLFDLVMLGVGEDGHTASLFPNTAILEEREKLVGSVYVPEKKTWRMSLTFKAIDQSALAVVYALGSSKEAIIPLVLHGALKSSFPASRVGTEEHKALWIMDKDASRLLK